MKRAVILFLLLTSYMGVAQQDPLTTQYFFNPLGVNAAYAGLHDMVSVNSIVRKQNIGLPESPTTFALNGHTSLPFDNAGVGVSILNESYGINNQFEANLSLAYRIVSLSGAKLSFGLQGGLFHFKHDAGSDKLNQDPNVQDSYFTSENNISKLKTSFGGGVMYSTDNYYVGVSMPRFFDVKFENEDGSYEIRQHYYFTGGMILDLTGVGSLAKLRPSFIFRFLDKSGDVAAATSLDLGSTLILKDMFWLGLSVRSSFTTWSVTSMNFIGEVQATDMVKFGLSYDFPFSQLRSFPTLELMANINLSVFDFQSVKVHYF